MSRHREGVFSTFAFMMKPNRARSRKSAVITNSRWLAYATASATSAFAGANSAEATIHYSGRINQVFDGFNGPHVATFQLASRGNFFRLTDSVRHCGGYLCGGAYFGIFAGYGASFAGRYNPECNLFNGLASVSRLVRGDLISNRPFVAAQSGNIALAVPEATSCGGYVGQFGGKGTGFIGFKFHALEGGDQYGWARIQMRTGSNRSQAFRLIDYAWGDVGDPITAGQTSSDEMVPEEGSLGWLTLGAVGLLAWRKRRSQAAR